MPRSAILVDSAKNPRSSVDEKELEGLVSSIKTVGLVQPVLVEPRAEGGYELVAGFTRLTALDAVHGSIEFDVPVQVRDADDPVESSLLSLVENVARNDMNPIDEARAMQRLIDDRGLSKLGVAQAIGKSQAFVTQRLELLDLPERCQEIIQAGRLPVSTAKSLRAMAKIDPDLAVRAATRCAGKEHWAGTLAKAPEQIANLLGQDPKESFWIIPGSYDADAVDALKVSNDRETSKRMRAFGEHRYDQQVHLRADAADQAIAAGVAYLIDEEKRHVLVTDAEVLEMLVDQAVSEREQNLAAHAKAEAERKLRSGKVKESLAPDASDEEKARDQARKEAEREQRLKDEVARFSARNTNIEFGNAVKGTSWTSPEHKDKAVELVCRELLSNLDLGDLATRGWRLIDEQLQEVKESESKATGVKRVKVSYEKTKGGCRLPVDEYLKGAKTADELLQRTTALLVIVAGARQDALTPSNRWSPGFASKAALKVATDLAKKVKPTSHKVVQHEQSW